MKGRFSRAQQALNKLEALQAKLTEQHTPVAWLHEETGDVISSELKADAQEMLKGYDVPLYKCPEFSCKGLLDSSNHIADMRKRSMTQAKPYAKTRSDTAGYEMVAMTILALSQALIVSMLDRQVLLVHIERAWMVSNWTRQLMQLLRSRNDAQT